MKVNLVTSSAINKPTPAVSNFINKAANECAAEWDVREHAAVMYLLTNANGQEIFAKYVKDKYNLNLTFWSWIDGDRPIAAGFEIEEDAAFTKVMLEQ